MMIWRLLRNWSFDLADDGNCRVDIFGFLSPCQIAMLDGDLEGLPDGMTFDDPSLA
jgi:hypothetical protein